MSSRYSQWAGPLVDVDKFGWERRIKKCTFKQQATKLIALLLVTYASEDGSSVRPGRERLSVVSGLSAKHVSTQLVKLEQMGLIYKVHNGSSYGRRGGLASVYKLTAPEALELAWQEDPDELQQVPLEEAMTKATFPEHVNPSSLVVEKQENSSSHVLNSQDLEHVNSAPEHVNSESEQGNSSPEHVNPSSPHQAVTPTKNHYPKEINQSSSVTLSDARVKTAAGQADGSKRYADFFEEELTFQQQKERTSALLLQRQAAFEKAMKESA